MPPPPPFEALMPEVQERSRRHYAHLDPEKREEAVQLSACFAWQLYDSAVRRENYRFTPATLTLYANRATDEGRRFSGGWVKKDAMRRGRTVGFDDLDADGRNVLAEALVQKRTSPLDATRISIDWRAFTSTLDERSRWMVTELAIGSTKTEIAHEAGLSSGRISQLCAEVGEQYADYFHTLPGFEVRARRAGKRKPGRKPRDAAA